MRVLAIQRFVSGPKPRGLLEKGRRLARRRGRRGPVHFIQRLLDTCYLASIAYICAVAFKPGLPEWMPAWFRWFGEAGPGSLATIAVVLAFPILRLALRWASKGKPLSGPPLGLLAAMAASALALGMSAYSQCRDTHAPLVAPLTWTLALFAGEEQPVVGSQAAGCGTVPVAFDLARLLAIATTLGTALTAAMTLFRAERDRIAIWRARSLTVVAGLDDDTVSMVRAIARTISPGERLAVLTRNANTNASCAIREFGANIRVVDLDQSEALSELPLWNRLDRLYLLSADPVENLKRFYVIDAQVGCDRRERVRLPLTVRIDNPWQAEVLRRSVLTRTDRRWAGDVVGRYEVTAAKLVRHMTHKRAGADPPVAVVLCGLSPLTYAMASAIAQLQREQELYDRSDVVLPASVIILARGAQSFVDDHRMRQRTMAPADAALPVKALDGEPTVDAIADCLHHDPASHAVIFGDPSMETAGTRLAARFPDLRVYMASAVSTALVDFSLVGHLYSFPINMELDMDAPQDVWERAAELIHEHYSEGKDRTRRAAKPWKDLDPFFKHSNRRQVLNALWMVENLGNHTWNSFESGPAAPLPPDFDTKDPLQQLTMLGFDEETVARMVKAEHEDWYSFYKDWGWHPAEERDDDHNLHDKLLPWDEFAQRPGFVHDARRSLVSTLINLRILGYRSVPRTTPHQAARNLRDVS
jgi:hypothetical protein